MIRNRLLMAKIRGKKNVLLNICLKNTSQALHITLDDYVKKVVYGGFEQKELSEWDRGINAMYIQGYLHPEDPIKITAKQCVIRTQHSFD